jgi:hypothetical protein
MPDGWRKNQVYKWLVLLIFTLSDFYYAWNAVFHARSIYLLDSKSKCPGTIRIYNGLDTYIWSNMCPVRGFVIGNTSWPPKLFLHRVCRGQLDYFLYLLPAILWDLCVSEYYEGGCIFRKAK